MISVREMSPFSTGNEALAMRVARALFGHASISQLSSEDLRQLGLAQWSLRTLHAGMTFFDQGDECQSVSVLLSGWAFRRQNLPDGKRQILDFVLTGSLLGFGSKESFRYGIETVTPCVIASLPTRQFYALLAKVPSLAIRVAEIAADSEIRAFANVTNLGRRSARERVAAFIVQMMERSATLKGTHSACQFELPITQVAIADALGLSNEHVCRTLGKLTAERRIRIEGHKITVIDPKGLTRDACLDEHLENGRVYETAVAA